MGTVCPLIAELNANAAIFNTKKLGTSPTVIHSLTHELAMQFTRPVVDAIVGLACAPTQGTSIDFTDAAYIQANAVVKAAVYGHCSFAEAASVLSERLDSAADSLAVEKIRGAMDTLKSASESAVNSATGTFMFVWAKVSHVGISVVYYSNRCSLLLTAFCCILVHFDAFSKISMHSILLHS